MRDIDMDIEHEGQRRKRMRAGVAASFLSAALHIILFLLVANTTFMIPALLERVKPELKSPPIILDEIRHETRILKPSPSTERGGGGGADGDAVNAAVGKSIEKGVESLAMAPREVMTEPKPVTENRMIGESRSVMEPGPTPARSVWQPRQEIVQIEKRLISDDVSSLPRRNIPKIERISKVPDLLLQADRDAVGRGESIGEPLSGAGLVIDDLLRGGAGGSGRGVGGPRVEGGLKVEEPGKRSKTGLFAEDPAKVTPVKPIEKLLIAEVTLYTSLTDWTYKYFKIEIKRAGAEVLPVISKDILLIQDCSNSMAEQRLHFCRDGMVRCLSEIGPADRFNVVMFRERSMNCFPDWAEAKQENIDKARKFMQEMTSEGNTDIFTAISEQMNVKRAPGRPVVAILVSDGIPTAGMVASSDIIGEFSKLNNGAISVFAMGTLQIANRYLLDLLGYCNRGDALVVTSGRWDIPDQLQRLMREISRPVLADTEFHFTADCQSEVYPVLASNLYLDRPLVLFGRCPKETKSLVFQAVGKSAETRCDMVFDLDLEKSVKKGDREIMEMWAKQKIYHVIGQNARQPNQANLDLIHNTAKEYGIRVPYRRILK